LLGFWRVDAVQPDLRLTDPDGIAVNDASGASNVGEGGERSEGRYDADDGEKVPHASFKQPL
jgi:hypothetical protein